MPGLIPHVAAGLIIALIIHFIHYKFEFSSAAFIGNLLPDVIKFGGAAIKQASLSVFYGTTDPLYTYIQDITGNLANWLGLGFFIFATGVFLYHYHYIKKKKMEEYDELYVFLLIGIVIHLLMDALVTEHGSWI